MINSFKPTKYGGTIMTTLMTEEETVKFQVKLHGQVLTEAPSRQLAEQFIMTLGEQQRNEAVVVPVTNGGHQVLLG